MFNRSLIFGALLTLLFLNGCGQMGNLYLPTPCYDNHPAAPNK